MTRSTAEFGSIYPCLTYDDAAAAIDWLCRAFGFVRRLVVPGPGDRIEHSELSLGGAVVMVSSPKAKMGRLGPGSLAGVSQTLSLHVDDPDTHYRRAEAAGAEIVQELKDDEHRSRGFMAKDPEGHLWYFGTYRPGAYWDDGEEG